MQIDVEMIDLGKCLREEQRAVGKAVREAVNDGTLGLKAELRAQVLDAGLGGRLANTWQSKVYKNDDDGLDTAGYIFSKAPDIIQSYSTGAIIAPLNGKRYLWIPTKSVPRARAMGRKSSTKRMTPEQVEREFRQPLAVRAGRGGRLLAFIVKERGTTNAGRLRKVRKGRRGFGDTGELVLMFNLVPSSRRARLLNIEGAADAWADRTAREVARLA